MKGPCPNVTTKANIVLNILMDMVEPCVYVLDTSTRIFGVMLWIGDIRKERKNVSQPGSGERKLQTIQIFRLVQTSGTYFEFRNHWSTTLTQRDV